MFTSVSYISNITPDFRVYRQTLHIELIGFTMNFTERGILIRETANRKDIELRKKNIY